ncbi:MAG: TldD protein [Myxococcota bacterium]|jgi:TldD protein
MISNAEGALAPFGVSPTLAREVLGRALSHGGDFCDLFFERSYSNRFKLTDGAVREASLTNDVGVGIRVVRGAETGYAYTESLDRASLLDAAGVAASVAAGGKPRSAPAELQVGKSAAYYTLPTPWAEVSTTDKVALMTNLEHRVRALDDRIEKVTVTYRDEHSDVVVLDSDGRIHADSQPMTICYVNCTAVDSEGRRESNYQGMGARAGIEWYTDERMEGVAREVVDRTLILFDAVPGPVGELPVVLGPGSSGILLHEAIGHGMEADAARKGTTIFSDMIGQSIAPDIVTIVDDATNPGLRGSINVDDEGNPAQRTTLVEQGVLRTFMHDRISAAHYGVEPTGNGRREGFRHMPLPRMRNTYMTAGPHDPEEIIKSVKRGIYADHFTNGQVNIGPGDFTFYVKNGWLIEDGKRTQPIKDVNLIGNGPEVLKGITMVGTDFRLDTGGWTCGKRGQSVPVGLGMPSVKVGAITVGGTQR